MKMDVLLCCLFLAVTLSLSGCVSLLPTARNVTKSPWQSFGEAKKAFDSVIPNQTTTRQLKSAGFDLYSTPNIKIMNYIDIAMAVQSIKKEDLDIGFQRCLQAKNRCRAYEFEPQYIYNIRNGNFWLDALNFRRKTKETGWRFKALFVVVDDIVVEKLWGGSPLIEGDKEVNNPLGPFQELGGMVPRFY